MNIKELFTGKRGKFFAVGLGIVVVLGFFMYSRRRSQGGANIDLAGYPSPATVSGGANYGNDQAREMQFMMEGLYSSLEGQMAEQEERFLKAFQLQDERYTQTVDTFAGTIKATQDNFKELLDTTRQDNNNLFAGIFNQLQNLTDVQSSIQRDMLNYAQKESHVYINVTDNSAYRNDGYTSPNTVYKGSERYTDGVITYTNPITKEVKTADYAGDAVMDIRMYYQPYEPSLGMTGRVDSPIGRAFDALSQSEKDRFQVMSGAEQRQFADSLARSLGA